MDTKHFILILALIYLAAGIIGSAISDDREGVKMTYMASLCLGVIANAV